MSILAGTLISILKTLTLDPASSLALIVTVTLSLIAAWFGFSKMVNALKFPMSSGSRPIASLTLMIVLCLLASAITKGYLSPKVSSHQLSGLLPLIAAVFVFFAAAVPLSCMLMKSKYLQTLSSFLVPIVAAAIVVFLAKGVTGAFREGEEGFSTSKKRTEGVNEVLLK